MADVTEKVMDAYDYFRSESENSCIANLYVFIPDGIDKVGKD
jgi:hypothetical protein